MQSLGQIFENSIFVVPDYQRGYAWEIPQIDDFWKDLNWLRPGQQHYTGMLTLYPFQPQNPMALTNEHRCYQVVDGQQRLTTALLLLGKLLWRATDGVVQGRPVQEISTTYLRASVAGEQVPVFQYESPQKTAFLLSLLHSPAKGARRGRGKSVYERNLLQASDFLRKKVLKLSREEIDDLYSRLTSQLVFDIHLVGSTFDLCAMFESINYRGKKLTKFEVLKNRLIYLGELLGQNGCSEEREQARRLREKIEGAWGFAFNCFGAGEKALDEDEFLLNHTLMYSGALKKEKEALENRLFTSEFAKDRLAADHKKPLTLNQLEQYVDNIRQSAELWAFQNSCLTTLSSRQRWITPEVTDWLLRLNRLGQRHFKALILGALSRMVAPDTTETSETLIRLLQRIERFIFIVYGMCDFHATERSKTEFGDYGSKIFQKDPDYCFENVCADIDEYLYSYDEDDIEEFTGIYSSQKFIDKVHARFVADNGWYDWKDEIKYFLSEWMAYHADQNQTVMPETDYQNCSVEHIMPQKTAAPGQWQSVHDELGRMLKYVVHDLGNLTLLGLGANKAVQDINLKGKAEAYRLSHDGRDILRRAGKGCNWGQAEIVARGIAMVEFMCRRWEVPGQEEESEFRFDYDAVLSSSIKPPRRSRRG